MPDTRTWEIDRRDAVRYLRADRGRISAARRLLAAVGAAPLQRVAHLAAEVLGADTAQVSLLADVETIAAVDGSPYAPVGSCCSLEDALCTATAAGTGPVMVTDARQDDTLMRLPAVAAGHVRSYLGAPLVDDCGRHLGALCVYGAEPRDWQDADVRVLRAMAATATATLEAAAVAAQRYALFASVSEDLASAADVRQAVGRLTRRLVPALGSWCIITLADPQENLQDLASWHADPARRETVAQYARLRQAGLGRESILHRALRSGRPVIVRDGLDSVIATVTGEARTVLNQLAPRAAYALPMRAGDLTVGAISLFLEAGEPDLSDDDVATLAELADRAGVLLESTRIHDRQREIAETLQRSLLSEPVQPPGTRVAARYVAAAEAAQVGGDWYDVFVQDGPQCMFVIGDVMGHDTLAAAGMSQVRTLLRGIAHTTGLPPAQLLAQLDTTMAALDTRTIATAVVMCLDPTATPDGRVTVRWANAGHLPPMLIEPDCRVHELHCASPALVLGVAPGTDRCEGVAEVPRGSTLVLYTDGLVERRDSDLPHRLAELRARLADLAQRAGGPAHLDPRRLLDDVLAGMVPEGSGQDDIAVLAVTLQDDGGVREGRTGAPPQ